MAIYTDIVQAFRAHWTKHENKYPKQITLSPAQAAEFQYQRETGAVGIAGAEKPDPKRFWSTPIVVDPASPGALVGVDGVEMPLQQQPATA